MSVMWIDPMKFVAAGGPCVTTYVGTTNDTGDKSTFTFSAVSFGSSTNANRVVVIGYAGRDTGTARTLSSATIDGSAATIGLQATMNSQVAHVGFFARVQGTDSSGDVVLTFSGNVNRGLCIFVWSVEGMTSVTPTDTDASDTTDPFTSSLDVSAGGVAFAVSHEGSGVGAGGSSISGTGFTEDADGVSSANGSGNAGHGDYAAAQTGLVITADLPGSSNSGACFIAYR